MHTRQIRQLFDQAPTSVGVNIFVGLSVAWILWDHLHPMLLAGWLAALVGVTGVRAVLSWGFRRVRQLEEIPPVWTRLFVFGAVASGALWGVGCLLFNLQLPFELQVLMAFVVGGMCAGGISVLAPLFPVYLAYLSVTMVPLILSFFFHGGSTHLVMGFMAIVYTVALMATARNYQRQLLSSLELAFEKAALVEDLSNQQSLLTEAQRLAQLGHWELDLTTQQLNWSDEVYRIFGLEQDGFGASYQAFLDAVHPEDRAMVADAFERSVRDQAPYDIVHRLLLADGEIRYVNERGQTFYDVAGKPLRSVGTVQDVTVYRRVEEEIRLRETALRATANSIVITDSAGAIEWVNPAFTELTGYSLEEVRGRNPRILKSGRQDSVFYQALWDTISSGEVWEGALVNRRKNGSLYHEWSTITPVHDHEGRIVHFVAVKRDISERMWTEEAVAYLFQSMVGITGRAYFGRVTRALCDWFQADGANIGELLDGRRIRAISMFLDGKEIKDYEYALCGTPCNAVMTHGPQLFAQNVAQRFPEDGELVNMGIQGYAGVPLTDKDGAASGIMWVVSRAPLQLPDSWKDVLSIIAAKASAELERMRAEADLRNKSAYLDSILRSSVNAAIIAADLEHHITYFNPAAERMFGHSAQEVLGRVITEIPLCEAMDAERFTEVIGIVAREGDYCFSAERETAGEMHYIDGRLSGIRGQEHQLIGHVLICEDITERRKVAELIEHQARFDSLTDLPNRRQLLDRLERNIAHCRRYGGLGALLFLDLDYFKQINDALGHAMGDGLLQAVAERLRSHLRRDDSAFRLGGDEFVILFPDVGGTANGAVQQARGGAEKLMELFATPFQVHDHQLHITPSVGITLFPTGGETAAEVLRKADSAMYQSKGRGRNTYRFFSADMQEMAQRRLRLQDDLREALEAEQLELYFQPQVDGAGRIVGAEALLRWRHPQRGMVSPEEFIPTAEESGQVLAIGEWVLQRALQQYQAWRLQPGGAGIGCVAVNISPVQFRQQNFSQRVEAILERSGADPRCLMLEFTEGMLLHDAEPSLEKIERLRRLGVRFSIDDFGTGYSSLSYLGRLPVDEIKIDRSLIHGLLAVPDDAKLVEAILTLAVHLELNVVAEGVETRAELEFLRDRGCKLFQGNYFHHPQPEAAFAQLLGQPSPEQG